jgi:hypothetical protein
MDRSWDDHARSSPVPRQPPPRAAPSPDDWELGHEQVNARLAAERLGTEFRVRLDRLGQRQECAMASCAYLDEQELDAGLALLLEDVEAGYEQLVADHGHALHAAAGASSAEDLDVRISRFRDLCDARRANLDSDSNKLPELIGLRGAIERGHTERCWPSAQIAGDADAAGPHRQAVALGVIQGITLLASRLGRAEMAVGLVALMVSAARALDGAAPMAGGEPPPVTVPLPAADDAFGRALAAWPGPGWAGHAPPRCVCVDTGQAQGQARSAGASRPLIYLADMWEPAKDRDDVLAPCGIPCQDGIQAWFAGGGNGDRPAVGLVVNGPADAIMAGPRGLDGELLVSFARSAIFHSSYDGTPRLAAAAMSAARALEVVALVDPGMNGGVWADVDPSRQQVAASLVFDGCVGDRMRFFRS